MFRFPWTNFHELNLDWILEVVKTAQEIFTNGENRIADALRISQEAKQTAEQAAAGVIGDGSVTTAKLANKAVTNAKLANNSVTSDNIVDRTIIGNDIAENTIESYNIKNGTIIGADIAENTIESYNIKNGTIIGADIADGTITANKLASGALRDYIVNEVVTVSIGNIPANDYREAQTDIDFRIGYDFVTLIPQYTNVGHAIAGTYIEANPPEGKLRIVAAVRNYTSTQLSNVTATVRVLWKRAI